MTQAGVVREEAGGGGQCLGVELAPVGWRPHRAWGRGAEALTAMQ